jgi:hypothetical protein
VAWYVCTVATEPVPVFVTRLFWDVEPADIDLEAHADYVLERVMSRGGWEAMRWLRRRYTAGVLADFLSRRGDRLTPRDLAYWSLVCGLEAEHAPGGGRPSWAT